MHTNIRSQDYAVLLACSSYCRTTEPISQEEEAKSDVCRLNLLDDSILFIAFITFNCFYFESHLRGHPGCSANGLLFLADTEEQHRERGSETKRKRPHERHQHG